MAPVVVVQSLSEPLALVVVVVHPAEVTADVVVLHVLAMVVLR